VYLHFFYVPVSNVSSLAVGFDTSCIATGNGAVYCWGKNDYGQIGNGTVGTNAKTATFVSGI
jgi:alpha-tubulin suppressor-like RCC1 family protein